MITPKSLSADACGDNGRNDEAQRHENRRTDFRREAGTERGEHDESDAGYRDRPARSRHHTAIVALSGSACAACNSRVVAQCLETVCYGRVVDVPFGVHLLPASNDSTVVAVENGQPGFVIRGMRVGLATITFAYRGVVTTLNVRVVDR